MFEHCIVILNKRKIMEINKSLKLIYVNMHNINFIIYL